MDNPRAQSIRILYLSPGEIVLLQLLLASIEVKKEHIQKKYVREVFMPKILPNTDQFIFESENKDIFLYEKRYDILSMAQYIETEYGHFKKGQKCDFLQRSL